MPRSLKAVQRIARAAAGALGRDAWLVRRARPWYESLLYRASGRRGVPWRINGEDFRIDPRFRNRLAEEYEADVARYLRQNITAGDVCVDVGANVGAYALQLARWSSPGGRVIAFEPNPEAVRVLERHVRMNGLMQTVEIVPFAAGACAQMVVLHAAGADGMSRLDAANPLLAGSARALSVPMTSLDAYCREHSVRPQWIVLDVEGFEGDVLAGARHIICSGSLRGIIAEFHPSVWTARPFDAGGIAPLLEDLRLTPTALAGQRDLFGQHGPVLLVPAA